MLRFNIDGLDGCWCSIYYFKWGTNGVDYLTREILDFKHDAKNAIQAFAKYAKVEFASFPMEIDYVIRVLGSAETIAKQPNRVRSVAVEIADELKAIYFPQLIIKTRTTRQLKWLGRAARKAELEGVYRINKDIDLNDKAILIVDDVTTTGTSLEVIAELIKSKYPRAKVYGYCLAKTINPEFSPGVKNDPSWAALYKRIYSGEKI